MHFVSTFKLLIVHSNVVWLSSANLLCCASWRVGGGPAPYNKTVCEIPIVVSELPITGGNLLVNLNAFVYFARILSVVHIVS